MAQFALSSAQSQCKLTHFIIPLLLLLDLALILLNFGQFVSFVCEKQIEIGNFFKIHTKKVFGFTLLIQKDLHFTFQPVTRVRC